MLRFDEKTVEHLDEKAMLQLIISNQHLVMRALTCPDQSMQETLRGRMTEMEKHFSWLSPEHWEELHSGQ